MLHCLYGENLKERVKGRLLLAFYVSPLYSFIHYLSIKYSLSTFQALFLNKIFKVSFLRFSYNKFLSYLFFLPTVMFSFMSFSNPYPLPPIPGRTLTDVVLWRQPYYYELMGASPLSCLEDSIFAAEILVLWFLQLPAHTFSVPRALCIGTVLWRSHVVIDILSCSPHFDLVWFCSSLCLL